MKKIINYIGFIALIAMLSSCMEEVGDFTVNGEAITGFELQGPDNNDTIKINTLALTETYVFEWAAAESGLESPIVYTILFDAADGDFSNPIWTKLSDNSGADAKATLTFDELKQIHAAAGGSGVASLKWNVKAENGSPNVKMGQVANNLKIALSSDGVSNFELVSPLDKSILKIDGSKETDPVVFDWNDATSGSGTVTYKLYIDAIDGDFSDPLLTLDADDNGTASQISKTNGEWNTLLEQNGIKEGSFIWTVKAISTDLEWTDNVFEVYFEFVNWNRPIYVVGDYNGWDNSDNAKYIISTPTSNRTAEGYIYLKQGGIKLATDHSWDNAHTFGDDGSGNLTNPGNNISVPADGYYLVRANLSEMTYSLTETVWGVIGDATAGGWGNQTDMTYDAVSQTFRLGIHLTSGGAFKFRGTSDWGINYGSTAEDGTSLDAGGKNIPVEMEDDYAITLDLSTPNEYTYSAHRWGVVGGATPDPTWTNDFNMTWDAANEVFTITIDLNPGEFKFRADDAWSVNFGGDLNALTQDGSNLSVAEAGNYTLTLDPWNKKATVTKN
ncbi:SusF/SusE family outer membrane protein [Maribellus sp. YY47]|uniref:SusF/SusE family outer membrane protein n=1 Tax=Maribellus sp. YY47 TaxID=2929486 RepID=UPI002001D42A|nr:SusF/SusE family outer membrane protein [Maribellus sp. YY47]MCK3685946.1 SusF/SusE family outer membrane protein [Maribellus sp. YY47]